MKTGIVWFTTDLRIKDQYSLARAIRENDQVIAVYFFPKKQTKFKAFGVENMSDFRANFIHQTLKDLSQQLAEMGVPLHIFSGAAQEYLPNFIAKHQCTAIYKLYEWTAEELEQEENVKSTLHKDIDWIYSNDQFLLPPELLPFSSIDQLPDVFTQFRKRVEKYSEIPAVLPPVNRDKTSLLPPPIPSLDELGYQKTVIDSRTAFPFKGGSQAGEEHLQNYIWNKQQLKTYKYTRNGLIGTDYSTKFSPWLAIGALSARQIYREVKAFEHEFGSNQSTYWVIFELLWRDYFKYVSLKYKDQLFLKGGIQQKEGDNHFNAEMFHQWCQGATSDDFVNANMIELNLTGWMSNRGRQNVASFLVHNLKQDWRAGAAYFESLLLDYDVHSNYGNWNYVAGIGNDPRNRIFNTRGQAERYDPKGTYRTLWLQKTLF